MLFELLSSLFSGFPSLKYGNKAGRNIDLFGSDPPGGRMKGDVIEREGGTYPS
jgi:hypothetical protein